MQDIDLQDQFLLAVAGGRAAKLPKQLPELDALIDRIENHRLEGRTRRYFQEFDELGYPSDFMDAISKSLDRRNDKYKRILLSLEKITKGLSSSFGVVIKGFTTYLLLEDCAVLRCGDIDLVVDDGENIIKSLLDNGFGKTRSAFLHEIGEYTKNDVEFDLQWGFPVPCYPSGGRISERTLTAHNIAPLSYIDANRLAESSEIRRIADWEFAIPTCEMAVLIAVSHAFQNFTNVWSISHRENAWLRLAELADILELTNSANFSPQKFSALALEFGAVDAVTWTNNVLVMLWNRDVFKLGSGTKNTSSMPICVWWNLWTRVSPTTRELIGTNWFPHDEIKVISSLAPGAGSGEAVVLRVHWKKKDWDGKPHFAVSTLDNELRVDIMEVSGIWPDKLRLRFDHKYSATEIEYDVRTSRIICFGSPMRLRVSRQQQTISVFLEWSLANRDVDEFYQTTYSPCFLGIAGFFNGDNVVTAATYLTKT